MSAAMPGPAPYTLPGPARPVRKLIYLHGFRSSPQSYKAQKTLQRMRDLGCAELLDLPALDVSPQRAAQRIAELAQGCDPAELAVIGSSLGGFYATWLAEQLGPACRAVLLNPAIHPELDLHRWLGVQTVYNSDATIEVLPEHLQQLVALQTPQITAPGRYLLIAATGDEVIDWTTMVRKYNGSRMHLVFGDNHALESFDDLVDLALAFCGLSQGE